MNKLPTDWFNALFRSIFDWISIGFWFEWSKAPSASRAFHADRCIFFPSKFNEKKLEIFNSIFRHSSVRLKNFWREFFFFNKWFHLEGSVKNPSVPAEVEAIGPVQNNFFFPFFFNSTRFSTINIIIKWAFVSWRVSIELAMELIFNPTGMMKFINDVSISNLLNRRWSHWLFKLPTPNFKFDSVWIW